MIAAKKVEESKSIPEIGVSLEMETGFSVVTGVVCNNEVTDKRLSVCLVPPRNSIFERVNKYSVYKNVSSDICLHSKLCTFVLSVRVWLTVSR